MEKKFNLPKTIFANEKFDSIESEINKLYSLIDDTKRLKIEPRIKSKECWCIYCGYPMHLKDCFLKGPTGL